MTSHQGRGAVRRATSVDVAREAGVSRATVSYVLNDTPHQKIPEATRERVREAAARLRYSPSAAARALSRGHSDIVLALQPAELPPHEQLDALIEHFADALADSGLTLLTYPWARGRRTLDHLWRSVTPAAVIAFQLDDDERTAMREAGITVIMEFFGVDDPLTRWVQSIQHDIARTQVDALVATGHRRLGYAVPAAPRLQHEADLRLHHTRRACAAHGLPDPVVHTIPHAPEAAAEAIADWLRQDPAVTAVCAYNDITALALLAGLRLNGLAAPDDLAVIGVYDIAAAALTDPPLSTVAIDSQAMAQYAATALLRCLRGAQEPEQPGPGVTRLVRRRSA